MKIQSKVKAGARNGCNPPVTSPGTPVIIRPGTAQPIP